MNDSFPAKKFQISFQGCMSELGGFQYCALSQTQLGAIVRPIHAAAPPRPGKRNLTPIRTADDISEVCLLARGSADSYRSNPVENPLDFTLISRQTFLWCCREHTRRFSAYFKGKLLWFWCWTVVWYGRIHTWACTGLVSAFIQSFRHCRRLARLLPSVGP